MLAAACDGAGDEPEEEEQTSGDERLDHRHTGERQIHCGEPPCPSPPYGAPAIDWV